MYEFSSSKSKLLMLTLVLALIGLSASAVTAQQNVKNPDTMIVATIGNIPTLDPAFGYDTAAAAAMQNMYETLIQPAGDSPEEFDPMLSTNVPSQGDGTISEDGTTYTFNIRQGVEFHNGDALTAGDVKYSFERALIQDRDGGPIWILLDTILDVGSWSGFVEGVAEDMGVLNEYQSDLEGFSKDDPSTYTDTMKQVDIEAFQRMDEHFEIDGNQFIVHLAKPAAYFLSTLVGNWAMIVDQAYVASNGGWPGTPNTWRFYHNPDRQDASLYEQSNGTGPYKLGNWDRAQNRLILVRNDDYWQEPADIKTAIIEGIDEFSTRFTLFQNGDADSIYVPREQVDQVDPLVQQQCTPQLGGEHFSLPENRDSACETVNEDGQFRLFKGLNGVTNQAVFYQYDISEGSQFLGSGELDGNGIPPDFFSDINVRKAFSYSFEYGTYIEEAFQDEAVQPTGPVPPNVPFSSPENPIYFHDLDKASAEFQLAFGGTGHIAPGGNGTLDTTERVLTGDDVMEDGMVMPGDNGVLETSALGDDEIVVEETGAVWENGFELTILFNSGNAQRQTATQIFKDNIESINDKFSIGVQSQNWSQYLDNLIAGNLSMFIIGWHEDYHDPHNWYTPFMASNGTFSGFQGETLINYAAENWDPLIDDASVAQSRDERQSLYDELALDYFKQAPAVVTVQAQGRHYEQMWMEGFIFNPLYPQSGQQYFYNFTK